MIAGVPFLLMTDVVKGFRCRAKDGDGAWCGGRRWKASSERTRGLLD